MTGDVHLQLTFVASVSGVSRYFAKTCFVFFIVKLRFKAMSAYLQQQQSLTKTSEVRGASKK